MRPFLPEFRAIDASLPTPCASDRNQSTVCSSPYNEALVPPTNRMWGIRPGLTAVALARKRTEFLFIDQGNSERHSCDLTWGIDPNILPKPCGLGFNVEKSTQKQGA